MFSYTFMTTPHSKTTSWHNLPSASYTVSITHVVSIAIMISSMTSTSTPTSRSSTATSMTHISTTTTEVTIPTFIMVGAWFIRRMSETLGGAAKFRGDGFNAVSGTVSTWFSSMC